MVTQAELASEEVEVRLSRPVDHIVHTKAPPRRGGDGGAPSDSDSAPLLGERASDRDRRGRIRCPKCRWTPSAHDRWQCSCLHIWNTFDTRGLCPACSRQWKDTACLRCQQWSKHEDWYER